MIKKQIRVADYLIAVADRPIAVADSLIADADLVFNLDLSKNSDIRNGFIRHSGHFVARVAREFSLLPPYLL